MLIEIEPGLVQTRPVPVWVWGGSRPLVFFRWCPDWMPPILNKPVYGRWLEVLGVLEKSPGKEACEGSGTAWEVGSPLRALQVPEQACEPPPKTDIAGKGASKKPRLTRGLPRSPQLVVRLGALSPAGGFGLRGCLACRLWRVRFARRPRVNSVYGFGFRV